MDVIEMRNSSSLNDEHSADSRGKGIKLVFVLFGLMCITQAALNVGLRLYFFLQTSNQTLSEERDELKQKLKDLTSFVESFQKQEWLYFNGSFYLGSTQKLSWQDGRQFCQERGADLIIINSEEEQKFASAFKEWRYIGLSDLETEGVFKWVDGSPLVTNFWNYGEPNNQHEGEHCVGINFPTDFDSWNDMVCENEELFICEKSNLIEAVMPY